MLIKRTGGATGRLSTQLNLVVEHRDNRQRLRGLMPADIGQRLGQFRPTDFPERGPILFRQTRDAQRIAGGPAMAVPERFALASMLEEAGFLFTRYRRS